MLHVTLARMPRDGLAECLRRLRHVAAIQRRARAASCICGCPMKATRSAFLAAEVGRQSSSPCLATRFMP
jgi:hypothetical protein